MAWEIGRTDDADLERRFSALVRRVAAAQEPDGYLNTAFGRPGQGAAVQRPRVGARAVLLRPPVPGRGRPAAHPTVGGRRPDRRRPTGGRPRLAVFGPDGSRRSAGTPRSSPRSPSSAGRRGSGATSSRPRCSSSAAGRGRCGDIECGRAYYQDDVPVREATVLRGHAVRANYLAAGAVDVAVETDDAELLGGADHAVGEHGRPAHLHHGRSGVAPHGRVVRRRLRAAAGPRLLRDVRRRRLDHVLLAAAARPGPPAVRRPDRADALQRRRDVARRTTARVLLHQHPAPAASRAPCPPTDVAVPRASSSLRAPWFAVSCCPPNVARTLASLAAYVATTDDDGLQIHQYAPVAHPHDAARRAAGRGRRRDGLPARRRGPGDGRRVRRRPAVDAHACGCRRGRPAPRCATPDGGRPRARGIGRRCGGAFAAGDVVELTLPVAPRLSVGRPAHRRGPRLRRRRARPARPVRRVRRPARGRRAGRRRGPAARPGGPLRRGRRARRRHARAGALGGRRVAVRGRTSERTAGSDRRGPARRVPRLGQPGPVDHARLDPAGLRTTGGGRRRPPPVGHTAATFATPSGRSRRPRTRSE